MKITIEGQFKPRWIGDTPAPLVRFWCTDLCDSEVCVGNPGPEACPILKMAREKGTLVGDRIHVFYPSDAHKAASKEQEEAAPGKFHPPWPPDGPDEERRHAFFEDKRADLPIAGAYWCGFPVDEMTRDELRILIANLGNELERQRAVRRETPYRTFLIGPEGGVCKEPGTMVGPEAGLSL